MKNTPEGAIRWFKWKFLRNVLPGYCDQDLYEEGVFEIEDWGDMDPYEYKITTTPVPGRNEHDVTLLIRLDEMSADVLRKRIRTDWARTITLFSSSAFDMGFKDVYLENKIGDIFAFGIRV